MKLKFYFPAIYLSPVGNAWEWWTWCTTNLQVVFHRNYEFMDAFHHCELRMTFDDIHWTSQFTIESRPISPSLSFSLCRAILIRKLPDRLISPNLFSLNETIREGNTRDAWRNEMSDPCEWYSIEMANVCVGVMLTSFYCSNKTKGNAKVNFSAFPSRILHEIYYIILI